MRTKIIVFGILMVLIRTGFAQDLYYIEASRNAIVRDDSNRNATLLLRLERGDQLNAVSGEQVNGFYNVFLPNGTTGWVSRYVVRLHGGRTEVVPEPVIPGVGGGLTTRQREYAEFHLAIGKPMGYKEIIREGYTIGYDPKLKIPVWVQYRLTAERSENNTFPRSDDFAEDAEVPPQARASLEDYASASGDYVRGHMAPAEDMRWNQAAEEQSNLLTNIAPQIGSTFNGSIWKSIENHVRSWAMDRQDITIICGPIFEVRPHVHDIERQPETDRQIVFNVIGDNNIAVPTAFFKIIVDMRQPQNPDVLAFLVPHIETVAGPEREIETYLTSIDQIEELSGLDFLTNLPENIQDNIERTIATQPW